MFYTIPIADRDFLSENHITQLEKIEFLIKAVAYNDMANERLDQEIFSGGIIIKPADATGQSYVRTATETDKVLIDNAYMTLTLTEVSDYVASLWDGENIKEVAIENGNMTIYFVNKTDQVITFQIPEASVNGMSQGQLEELHFMPKTSGYLDITFPSAYIKENIITKIDMLCRAFIYGEKEFGNDLLTERVVIYPEGEEQVKLFTKEEKSTDKVLIDNEWITIRSLETKDLTEIKNHNIQLYITNKTQQDIQVVLEDVVANGIYINDVNEPSLKEIKSYLFAGESAYCSAETAGVLSDANMTELEKFEATLRVYPLDYKDGTVGEDFVKETITIEP